MAAVLSSTDLSRSDTRINIIQVTKRQQVLYIIVWHNDNIDKRDKYTTFCFIWYLSLCTYDITSSLDLYSF